MMIAVMQNVPRKKHSVHFFGLFFLLVLYGPMLPRFGRVGRLSRRRCFVASIARCLGKCRTGITPCQHACNKDKIDVSTNDVIAESPVDALRFALRALRGSAMVAVAAVAIFHATYRGGAVAAFLALPCHGLEE